MRFTNSQLEGYSGHNIQGDMGVKGLEKMTDGKVLIIGKGRSCLNICG